jgi:hypothetical protein
MIKIIPQLLEPEWVIDYGQYFAKLFANHPETVQSGIHIKDIGIRGEFRSYLAAKLAPLNLGHWLADYCSIRNQPPNAAAKGLPWHQDSAVVLGRTFGWIRGTVVWIPFTEIDFYTPSLEISDSRWPMWHRGNQQTGYLESIKRPRGHIDTPPFMNLGDVLTFDINHPHRTFIGEWMTKPRISADLRFTRSIPYTYKGKIIG